MNFVKNLSLKDLFTTREKATTKPTTQHVQPTGKAASQQNTHAAINSLHLDTPLEGNHIPPGTMSLHLSAGIR